MHNVIFLKLTRVHNVHNLTIFLFYKLARVHNVHNLTRFLLFKPTRVHNVHNLFVLKDLYGAQCAQSN